MYTVMVAIDVHVSTAVDIFTQRTLEIQTQCTVRHNKVRMLSVWYVF
jgi:hypothetical protein